MSDIKASIISIVLVGLLEGQTLNRKHFNNRSLHSWISNLRNKGFIPIEGDRTHDRTHNYYIKPEEIARYKNPLLREQQVLEMKAEVEYRRMQKAMKKL